MNDASRDARAGRDVRNYMLFSFAALLVMVPLLLLKGLDLWCVFPLLIGALSLMAHWRAGPVFLLLSLGVLVSLRALGYDPVTCVQVGVIDRLLGQGPGLTSVTTLPATPFLDFVLSVCVLAFVAGHYRLQALVYSVAQPERRGAAATDRTPASPPPPRVNPRRADGQVTAWEMPLLAAAAVVSGVAAEHVWNYFRGQRPKLGLSAHGSAALTFIWASAAALVLAWAFFGYVRRCRMSRDEALLYLQDQCWRQGRREQGRVSRWLAWARWRGRRRKEGGR
jgi:hypothetical protein